MELQKDYFKTLTTDHLLSMRRQEYCGNPFCSKSRSYTLSDGGGGGYILHKPTLLAELATRPHRVRARDRRKTK